jgi:hypothetical protein
MTVAALELNDQSLLIQAEDGALHAEPGFARLTRDGIVSGEEARAVAWREPQHVYNQYWSQLSDAPLPIRHRFARNHADIAFAQLQKLWRNAGSPDTLILLVPASFAHAQLQLLLGMVAALPATTAAVIDNALAACLDLGGDSLYVDLQLHEAVLTVCRSQDGAIRIVDQDIFPGFGMNQVQNVIARHISNFMIENYRFDPLHSSEAEQAIYDQLPHWLTRLEWEPDVSIKLSSQHGEHTCILNRDRIKTLIADRFASSRSFIGKWRASRLVLSPASGLLKGLVDEFAGIGVAGQTAATQRCLSSHAQLLEQAGDLRRLRELQLPEIAEASAAGLNGDRLATHLLHGDLALPLNKPVSIRMTDHGPVLKSEFDDRAAVTVVLRHHALETLQQAGEVALPPSPQAGESIRIGEHEFRLIRVSEG